MRASLALAVGVCQDISEEGEYVLFVRPINTKGQQTNVTNPFGPNHKGTDYGYPDGTPIYASESGKVTIAKNDEVRQWIANSNNDPFPHPRVLRKEDYGNFVKIDHGGGMATLYAHMKHKSITVTPGVQVRKGQKIGEVGSTGNSTGNHVHWEIRSRETVVDPFPLMDSWFTGYESNQPTPPVPPTEDPRDKKIRELEAEKNDLDKQKREWENRARTLEFDLMDQHVKYNGLKTAIVEARKALNSVSI